MDDSNLYDDSWNLVGGEIILEKQYLLYGYGKTNQAVRAYLDIHHQAYWIYDDNHENDDMLTDLLLAHTKAIIKSPGIRFDRALLEKARAYHIPIWSDLAFYYQLYPQHEYVIVTGSLGKTTVSTWINQMLSVLPRFENHLVGNIGRPIFQVQSDKPIGLVVEASSFMLHDTERLIPKVYVLTNLFAHHLDYHQTLACYAKDKLKIIAQMKEKDVWIYPSDDQTIQHYLKLCFSHPLPVRQLTFSLTDDTADCYLRNGSIYYHQNKIIDIASLTRQETHNIKNAMAAILVGQVYGIEKEWMSYVLRSFQGVTYRFETIYQTEDLVIINDAKSTTPEATRFAIETVNQLYSGYDKIVILGGKMPPEDYENLNQVIASFDWIYLYGRDKYQLAIKLKGKSMWVYDTLEEVIQSLPHQKQMVMLYSPSCVSYDQYRSFEERGAHFNLLIYSIFLKYHQKINKI